MAEAGKKVQSLRKRHEFLALRQAPRFAGQDFVMQGDLVPGSAGDTEAVQAGYTVTKKLGNAVIRNRIKRRLRAALALAVGDANLNANVTVDSNKSEGLGGRVVLIARPGALNQEFASLRGNITKGIDHLLAKGNKANKTNP
jgi:ribonuclease P protein component